MTNGKSTDHGHDSAGKDQNVLPVLFQLGNIDDSHVDQKCGRTVSVMERDLRCVDIRCAEDQIKEKKRYHKEKPVGLFRKERGK